MEIVRRLEKCSKCQGYGYYWLDVGDRVGENQIQRSCENCKGKGFKFPEIKHFNA